MFLTWGVEGGGEGGLISVTYLGCSGDGGSDRGRGEAPGTVAGTRSRPRGPLPLDTRHWKTVRHSSCLPKQEKHRVKQSFTFYIPTWITITVSFV